jgi:hypothetical protein
MAKRIDPKAKAKRQKIMAIGGAVVLVGLLAIQVPRTMKMLNATAPPPRSSASAPATPVPGADPSVLPTPGAAVAATPAQPNGTLIDSDAPPAPEAGQLVSFGRFASKDPFVEQIDDSGASPGGSGGAGGGGSAGSGGGGSGGGSAGSGGSADGGIVGRTDNGGSTPTGTVGGAVIAVNGVEEAVSVKKEFPAEAPVFVLVSVTRAEARVAIAGGAFASGAPTVTLRLGKPLTLVNTADGVRYELKLVKTG